MDFVERRGSVALAGKFAVETAIERRLGTPPRQPVSPRWAWVPGAITGPIRIILP
jgi:hypothetical protein